MRSETTRCRGGGAGGGGRGVPLDVELPGRTARAAMTAGWRVYCPVVVLLAVAGAQLVLVRRAGLTPWKGGGFGMFAAVDGGAVRSVRIVVEGPGRSEVLDVPPSLELDAERAAALPITGLLARVADGVAARAVRRGERLSRVIVEVWTATLSADGSQANAHRLARFEYPIGAPGR